MSLGVIWGLVVDEQVGITLFAWLAIRTGMTAPPVRVELDPQEVELVGIALQNLLRSGWGGLHEATPVRVLLAPGLARADDPQRDDPHRDEGQR